MTSKQIKQNKALAAAGFKASELFHIAPDEQRCGFGRMGVDVWIHVNRGLLLFVTANVTPAMLEGMSATLYGFGEERNQNVLGVGRDVACFIVGQEKARRLVEGVGHG